MPNYRRAHFPGGCFFFTVVTAGRAPILVTDRARAYLRAAFLEAKERWPFRIGAIVLLPEHLHTIWQLPHGDANYARRWARIKQGFTRQWLSTCGQEQEVTPSKDQARRRGVWQRRYWEHCIRNEVDLKHHW